MKSLLFSVIALSSSKALAQVSDQNSCSIYYTYDDAGHRTERSYRCYNPSSSIGRFLPEVQNEPSQDEEVQKVVLYPNPTQALITLKFSKEVEDGVLYVYDFKGQLLLQKNVRGLQEYVDLNAFPSGSYSLSLQEGTSVVNTIAIKE